MSGPLAGDPQALVDCLPARAAELAAQAAGRDDLGAALRELTERVQKGPEPRQIRWLYIYSRQLVSLSPVSRLSTVVPQLFALASAWAEADEARGLSVLSAVARALGPARTCALACECVIGGFRPLYTPPTPGLLLTCFGPAELFTALSGCCVKQSEASPARNAVYAFIHALLAKRAGLGHTEFLGVLGALAAVTPMTPAAPLAAVKGRASRDTFSLPPALALCLDRVIGMVHDSLAAGTGGYRGGRCATRGPGALTDAASGGRGGAQGASREGLAVAGPVGSVEAGESIGSAARAPASLAPNAAPSPALQQPQRSGLRVSQTFPSVLMTAAALLDYLAGFGIFRSAEHFRTRGGVYMLLYGRIVVFHAACRRLASLDPIWRVLLERGQKGQKDQDARWRGERLPSARDALDRLLGFLVEHERHPSLSRASQQSEIITSFDCVRVSLGYALPEALASEALGSCSRAEAQKVLSSLERSVSAVCDSFVRAVAYGSHTALQNYERRILEVCEASHPLARFMLVRAIADVTEARLQSPMILRLVEKCLPAHAGEIYASADELDEILGIPARPGDGEDPFPEITPLVRKLFDLVFRIVRALPRLPVEQTFGDYLRALSCLRPMLALCSHGGASALESLLSYAVDSLADNDPRRVSASCAVISYVPLWAARDHGSPVARLVRRAFQILCARLGAGVGISAKPDQAQALCVAAGNALACLSPALMVGGEEGLEAVLTLVSDLGAALQAIGVQALNTLGRGLAPAVLAACELETGLLRLLLAAGAGGALIEEAAAQCVKFVPAVSDLFAAPSRSVKLAASELFLAFTAVILRGAPGRGEGRDRQAEASRALVWQLLDGSHTAARQARIGSALSCAAVAKAAGLAAVVPWMLEEYVVSQSAAVQYTALKGLSFSLGQCEVTRDNLESFPRVMDMVTALISDTAGARERVFRQLAAELAKSIVAGVPRSFVSTLGVGEQEEQGKQGKQGAPSDSAGLANSLDPAGLAALTAWTSPAGPPLLHSNTLDLLTHYLNLIFPNVLDSADSNFQALILDSVCNLLEAMGEYGARYVWAGLYHPAARVRGAYAALYREWSRRLPTQTLGIALRRDVGQLSVYSDGEAAGGTGPSPGPVSIPAPGTCYYRHAMGAAGSLAGAASASGPRWGGSDGGSIFRGPLADASSWAPELDWRA